MMRVSGWLVLLGRSQASKDAEIMMLRALPAEIAGQARQLCRFGSPGQVERAAALLEDVKRELHAILANGPTRDEHAEGTGT